MLTVCYTLSFGFKTLMTWYRDCCRSKDEAIETVLLNPSLPCREKCPVMVMSRLIMPDDHASRWAAAHPLEPIHVDCATAVMLKILDGKCKMSEQEQCVMTLLYDAVKNLPGRLLDSELHQLIADARQYLDEAGRTVLYEKRVLAETVISRPVMKAFKAMIREQGLFVPGPGETVT